MSVRLSVCLSVYGGLPLPPPLSRSLPEHTVVNSDKILLHWTVHGSILSWQMPINNLGSLSLLKWENKHIIIIISNACTIKESSFFRTPRGLEMDSKNREMKKTFPWYLWKGYKVKRCFKLTRSIKNCGFEK